MTPHRTALGDGTKQRVCQGDCIGRYRRGSAGRAGSLVPRQQVMCTRCCWNNRPLAPPASRLAIQNGHAAAPSPIPDRAAASAARHSRKVVVPAMQSQVRPWQTASAVSAQPKPAPRFHGAASKPGAGTTVVPRRTERIKRIRRPLLLKLIRGLDRSRHHRPCHPGNRSSALGISPPCAWPPWVSSESSRVLDHEALEQRRATPSRMSSAMRNAPGPAASRSAKIR